MSINVTFQAKEGISASLNMVTGETKLSKWNDKAWLKLNQSGALVGSSKIGDKYKLTYGDYAVQVYDVSEGLEYEIVIGKIPASNVFSIPVTIENLTFYYQPALTPAEIAEGAVRPENVVGSYAVYHSSKQGGEYQTGKAFHIYRPLVTAADGKTIWGILNYDGANLTVTVDSAWLAKAKYPVVVDPTFGYTDVGVTNWNAWNAYKFASKFTCASTGDVSVISLYVSSTGLSGGDVRVALYSHDAGNNRPNAKLVESATETCDKDAWHDFIVASTGVTATDYWLAAAYITDNAVCIRYDGGSGTVNTQAGGTFPATWGADDGGLARMVSIHADYTATSTYSPKTRSGLVNTMTTLLNSKILFN
jgi:hypothetical protein